MAKKQRRIGNLEIWQQLGSATTDSGSRTLREARLIDLSLIRASPSQPRQSFDAESLQELAGSIREHGLLQPILVRPEGDGYVIIAGQRRYEACLLLDMEEIPAVVREASEQEAIEQALIENIQREDINPVEEAASYRALMDEHGYSIRHMAAKMHKSVGYIHGRLELLKHEDIASSVGEGGLGIFEARELAKIEDARARRKLMRRVLAGELDRDSLQREVRQLTQREGAQPVRFNPQTFVRRWGRFRRELGGLDPGELESGEREQARQMLEEMRQTIEEMLGRWEGEDPGGS